MFTCTTKEKKMENYYYLKKGEIVEEGDEVEVSSSLSSPAKWQKTKCVGWEAPDPQYPSHRTYRRLIKEN